MTKRVYGAKYDETLKVKDIAEKIRREVRLEANLGLLPKGKWSVTSTLNSISVSFAPLVEEDELFARAYWNRERVIDDVEQERFGGNMRTLASEFGLALHERIEQKLRDFNHDGSDSQSDYFDVNFYTTVSIRPRTDRPMMMDLYRAGEWADKTLAELNQVWDAMWEVWKKEATPAVAEAPPPPVLVKVGDELQLEGGERMQVLRVFPRPDDAKVVAGLTVLQGGLSTREDTRPRVYRDINRIATELHRLNNQPVETPSNLTDLEKHDARMFEAPGLAKTRAYRDLNRIANQLVTGMTVAEVAKAAGVPEEKVEEVRTQYLNEMPELRKLLDANTKVRLPRRASRAVPVEEPVPQAPNEAWLKLAQAYDLQLDWAIPGLGERP